MGFFRRDEPQTETVHRAAERTQTSQPGITSWHCFSAGEHYDPENLGFGSLIGLDEHLIEPGAGFTSHAHRGVEILSWVLEGALRHQDESGRVEIIEPGSVLHQSTGSGIGHSESNASTSDPLRLVQLTLLGEVGAPRCVTVAPPVLLPGIGLLEVLPGKAELELPSAYLYVTRGAFSIAGNPLEPGDSLRLRATMALAGDGEILVWTSGTAIKDKSNA
ncbi:MAG: pirin family protein [Jatrophihabitantaceae bacterium]